MSFLPAAHARRLSSVVLAFAAAFALFALLAARADAAYTVPNFSVGATPAQAAGHPNLTVSIDPDAAKADLVGDDLKNITIDAPTGMVLNQAAAATKCTSAQLAGDACPSASVVGSITVKWRTFLGGSVSGSGTLYVMATPAGNAASLGIVLRPMNYKRVAFPIAVTNAVPYAAPTRLSVTSIPRTLQTSGLIPLTVNVTIDQIDVTINARAGATATGPYFTLSPSACSAATTQATFVSYSNVSVAKSSSVTPTGCGTVPFTPSASIQAAISAANAPTPISTIFEVPQDETGTQQSALKSFSVDMPSGTKLNTTAINAVSALCTDAKLTADTCPSGSRVGNAATRTPLWDDPFSGDLYLMTRNSASLGLGFVLRNPATGSKLSMKATETMVDVTGDGNADLVRQTISGIPQIPWSAWYLNVNSPLVLNPATTCSTVSATGQLSAWSGSSATVVSPWYIAPSDCNPDTTITSGPSGATNATSPAFAFTGSSSGLAFQCQWDLGAWDACSSPIAPPAPLGDGPHQFCVRAVSGSNVDPTPACAQFSVDTVAPSVVIQSVSPDNGNFQATFTATDASQITSVNCRLDVTDYPNCVSPFIASGAGGGSHTFRVCATDAAGNTGCATVVVDVFPTTVTITGGPTGLVNSQPVTFTFTSNGQNESYLCNLDGAAFSACASPTMYTGLSQGGHVFCVRGVDPWGIPSLNTDCRSFTYDSVPPAAPTVVRTNPTANPTNSTAQTIAVIPAEAGGTLQGSLDGAAFASISSPVQLTGLSFGSHTYSARQTDAAGNVSGASTVAWTVAIDPSVTITSSPPAYSGSPAANFSFTGPTGASYECQLDGGAWTACTTPIAYTGLAQGSHTFCVRAVTIDGVTPPACKTWIADTIPPLVTITSPVNNSTLSSTSVQLVFTVTDPSPIISVTCALDSAAATPCTSPTLYSGLPQAVHTIRVCAVDAAGNTGCSTVSFLPPGPPPPPPIVTGPTGLVASTSATISFTSTVSPVVFSCALDGQAFASCVSPVPLTGLAQGPHTYCVRITDAQGNTGSATCISWIVDTIAPTVVIADPTWSGSTTAQFTFTTSDASAIAAVTCRLDGGGEATCSSPVTFTGLAVGTHTLTVCATDAAGNKGCTNKVFTPPGGPPPPVTITSGPSGLVTSSSATFTFTGAPIGGSYQCQLDGGPWMACTSPKLYTLLPDGTHTFCVRAIDAAGNVGTPTCRTWTALIEPPPPPVLTRVAPVNSPSSSTSATFTISGLEPGSVAQGSLDGGAFAMVNSPVNFSGLANGTHTFSVRVVDPAGNTGPTVSNTWVVDTVPPPPPVVTRTNPVENPTTLTSQVFSVTDAESGVRLEASLDGAAYATITSPVTLTGLGAGTHVFSARAVDPAGNISAVSSVAWTIQAGSPVTTISTSTTQAGATPDLTVSTVFNTPYDPTNVTLQWPKGLGIASDDVPQCTIPDAAAGACPAISRIGDAQASFDSGASQVNAAGGVYLTAPPSAGMLAGISLKLDLGGSLGSLVVGGQLYAVNNGQNVRLEFTSLPTTSSGGGTVHLRSLGYTLTGSLGGTPATFNPGTCPATADTASVVTTANGQQSPAQLISYPVTGCSSLGFAPTADVSFSSLNAGDTTRVHVHVSNPVGNAPLTSVRTVLPNFLVPNFPAHGPSSTQCPSTSMPLATSVFNPAACPATAKIGSMSFRSTLLGGVVGGDILLINRAPYNWYGFVTRTFNGGPATSFLTLGFDNGVDSCETDFLCIAMNLGGLTSLGVTSLDYEIGGIDRTPYDSNLFVVPPPEECGTYPAPDDATTTLTGPSPVTVSQMFDVIGC